MLANVFDITSCFRLSLPCGGRLISVIHIRSMEKISTHALRGEGDLCVIARDEFKLAFQSTPSVGRATRCRRGYTKSSEHFNPRPPWGGRRQKSGRRSREKEFQSTPSVGRATA